MILISKAEIDMIRVFCAEPFRSFSVSELAERAGISRSWVYRVLENLRENNMLFEERKAYRLDYSKIICKRLKLLFDSEFILSLNIGERVLRIAERIMHENSPESVVLVGSVALSKHVEESDMDFLVISSRKEVPLTGNVNIVVLDMKEFERKFIAGDDFIVSALAYGKVIHDREYFTGFYAKPLPAFSTEVVQEKIEMCEKLRDRVYNLVRVDEEKAKEELLNLGLQCARVILLRKSIIPGVKRDIPEQVKSENRELAEIIKRSMSRKLGKREMLEYLKFCSKLISEL